LPNDAFYHRFQPKEGNGTMLKTITKMGVAGLMVLALQTAPASAQYYHHHYYHHASRYNHHYQRCKTGGTIAGVVVGGVLGNALTHHSGAGTVVGAAAGGLAGHQIAHNNCRRY
jgi:hypothetical protein